MKLNLYNFGQGKTRQLRDTVSIIDGKLKYNGDYADWCLAHARMKLQSDLNREPTPEEILRESAKLLPNAELIEGE